MIGYWIQFAKSGDPNVDGLPEWPRFDTASQRYLELGDEVVVGEGLCRDRCDQIEEIVRKLEPSL